MTTELKFYLRLVYHRLPIMVALFLICSGVSAVLALRLPPVYSTSATLLVEAAQVSTSDARAGGRNDATEILDIIQRRLLTRANLIDTARENKIFQNQSTMNPDEVVQEMRRRTSVRRSSGRSEATLMTISFEGENPRQIASVVNQYVTVALEANSAIRTNRAEGALEFFEQEVQRLSQDLDVQSARIVAFKEQNANALPENLDYRLSRRSLLQERLSRAERDIEALEDQKQNIIRVYEMTGSLNTGPERFASAEEAELQRLEAELRRALSVYSETNPRVVMLRNQVAAVKSQVEDMRSAMIDNPSDVPDEQATLLDINLAEIDSRMEALRREVSEITIELEALQVSIEQTPTNRIALAGLERELSNTQSLYSASVQRLSQARTAERIEVSAKGERISVLEPASAPQSPSGPNRLGIMGMGAAVGMALAVGFFALMEIFNQAIRRPIDIEKSLGITPLATIPRFETMADRRRRRILQISAIGFVLIFVPLSLWAVDSFYMPLDQLASKVIQRLF